MTDPFRSKDRPRLKPLQVPGLPRPIEFRDDQLRVGRASDNDLTLPGEIFPSVSTHHARFSLEEGVVWVEDLGSRNGTLVNGSPVTERTRLASGDIVQFGPIGPRFLVMTSSQLSETVFIDPKQVEGPRGSDTLSATRMERIKAALGVPEGGVEVLVERRTRRAQVTGIVAVALTAVALVLWSRHIFNQSEEVRRASDERHEEELARARSEVDMLTSRFETSLEELRRRDEGDLEALEQVREDFELERERLREDKILLQQRLERLEADESASAESLAAVRAELEQAREQLELIDPVNLAQERLSDVARVRSTVVLIEVSMYLRDTDSGKLLYESYTGVPNFDDQGVPFELASTGSGFCVSPHGWILTNAHVVRPDEQDDVVRRFAGSSIVPEPELRVVFSDSSERHEATLHSYVYDGDEDLALVRIEPFEGMPHLEDFQLDVPQLEPGSDVFLFGFPLGHYALQEGNTVIASTFRGILSRYVSPYLQVDAGVHPGNSGGPVTDATGRVIGIVVSVQSTPDRSAVYTIGYAIPIAAAAKVWPPRPEKDLAGAKEAASALPAAAGEER